MKLIAILLFIALSEVHAKSYAQSITIHEKNIAVEQVLLLIEKQSSYHFIYDSKLNILKTKTVNINADHAAINDVIDKCLVNLPVSYTIIQKTIAIKSKDEIVDVQKNKQQLLKISGVVTDEKGDPLPGVNIIEKGTNNGVVSNTSGNYSITVADLNSTLVFSFIGYDSKEIKIGDQTIINVRLNAKASDLNEVVVVGYGTRQKASLTGAVSSVNAADIKNQVSNNVLNAIAGKIAGVQIISTSGAPGASPIVRIRGTGSIGASNQPLYVVDGLPLADASDINQINYADIETMDVLKEASAAAIYGSRGSNGVILITTKKGKVGQSQIDLNYYTGIQDVPKRLDMNDRDEEVAWWKQGTAQLWSILGGDPSVPNGSRLYNGSAKWVNYLPSFDNPSALPNTDWQSVFLNDHAPTSNYQVAARGGTEKARYYASGSYLTQDGVIKTTGVKRYTGRINLDANVNKITKVGVNFSPSYSIENIRNTDRHINSPDVDADYILGSLVQSTTLLSKDPVTGVYGGNAGNYNLPYNTVGYGAAANPLQIIENPLYKWTYENFRLNGVSFLEVEPIKGLVFHADFGINTTTGVTNKYRPSTISVLASGTIVNSTGAPLASNLLNIASSHGELRNVNYDWNNTVNWQKTFNNVHSINILGGYAYQKAIGESSGVSGLAGSFQNDAVQYVSAATTLVASVPGKAQWSLLSYFGRFNYTYKNKYILDGSLRSDGSSRFGANKRYALFPAAGFAWRVSEESFIKKFTFVSDLKLRAGYGKTGNTGIGNYPSLATLGGANYNFGNTLAPGFTPASIANPDLTWETTTTTDGGIDIGLFKNRLNLSFDYYNRATNGLLYGLQLPAISGFTSQITNIGNIQNRGIELTINSINIDKKDFQWSTNFNFSKNKNKVVALGTNNSDVVSYNSESNFSQQLFRVGEPMGIFYGYKLGGIFKDQADVNAHPEMRLKNAGGVLQGGPGDSKIVDVNGDGQITIADKTKLGDPNPNFTYGITNHFVYKKFDLDIQLQGVNGGDIEFLAARFIGNDQLDWNQLSEAVANRWVSPGQPGNGIFPRVSTTANPSVGLAETNSDRWLRDASYLRIRNVTLGYILPSNLAKKVHMSSLRIYATAQNLYTFTKYLGYNPDVSINGEAPGQQGIDYSTYPLARTFTLGINISL